MLPALRKVLNIVVGVCAFVSVVATATDAIAGYGHPFVSSFGSFASVEGVAVDSSTGDVYVFDSNAGSIFKFDSTGQPANFAATGTNAIGGLQGKGPAENELAVDNSSGPAKGDIYLATSGSSNVKIFSATGSQIGELSNQGGEACGVAVDPSGNVYVAVYQNHVYKWVPSGNPVSGEPTSSMGGLEEPCNIAVDSTGSVFANTWSPFGGLVTRYEAAQFGSLSAVGDVIERKGSTLAVDPATDDVYVDENAQVAQFTAHGEPEEAPLATFGAAGPGAFSGSSYGIAVSGFNHDIYVSNGFGGQGVDIYGPLVSVANADVVTGGASSVQPGSATLSGTVDPNGSELFECKFEYGTTTSYDQTAPCAESVAEIGSGSSPVDVHVDLTGLSPNTEYHFRLVALNLGGTSSGSDQSFTTVGPPSVGTGLATNLGAEIATVVGTVNPNRSPLSECTFEYGLTAAPYSQSVACAESAAQIGTGSSPVEVHADLTGLQPGTTYHYRLVAANAYGSRPGGDQSFTTPAPPLVTNELAFNVAQTEADVGAQVDPNGAATSYHLEYGTSSSYGQSTPESEAIGGANDYHDHGITVHLAGLIPGTSYHARLVATNSTANTAGADFTFNTYLAQQPSSACPNETRREEQNATYLPDCRAYEQVSPSDKNGTDVLGEAKEIEVADSGEGIGYHAGAGFGSVVGSGGLGFIDYLAKRGSNGEWASHGVTPTPASDAFQLLTGATITLAYSETMDRSFVRAYDLPQVSDDIPQRTNFYVEDTNTRTVETVTKAVPGETYGLYAAEASPRQHLSRDLGVVAIETEENLLPGMPSGMKYYAWRHGNLELAGVLPDGSVPAGGSGAASLISSDYYDSVSRDGSRLLFRSPAAESAQSQLYMRRDGNDTVWISEPESATAPAMPHEVYYQGMTEDGSHVLFTSSDALTAADPGGAGVGLYIYTDGPHPESEQNLTFVARVNVYSYELARENAVAGFSQDAKRIYFFTHAVGQTQEGLYLWDEGKTHFVAASGQPLSRGPVLSNTIAETSADGRRLAFVSNEKLTQAPIGEFDETMYVYEESTEALTCVSCLPTGQPTSSSVFIEPDATHFVGASLSDQFTPRFFSEDGVYVFFSTADALLSRDTNKLMDVYEYDTETGAVSLLTSGTGEAGSWFVGSGANGRDVFFVGRQSYLAQDPDQLIDLYDVRVGGGIPQPKPQTGGCQGDECQGVPSAAPSFNTASGFKGLGNVSSQSASPHKLNGKKATRSQLLAHALKACKRKRRAVRHRCEAEARKRYGLGRTKKKTSHGAGH